MGSCVSRRPRHQGRGDAPDTAECGDGHSTPLSPASAISVRNVGPMIAISALKGTTVERLLVDGCMIDPPFLFALSHKTETRELTMKNSGCCGNVNLQFLPCLHELENMKIDCPQLMAIRPWPLVDLVNLRRVTLGVEGIAYHDVQILNATNAEVSLIVHCRGCTPDLDILPLIEKLTGLKLIDFGTSTFPAVVGDLSSLTSLSFQNGTLAASLACFDPDLDGDPMMPDFPLISLSLRQLEIFCNADRGVMDNFFKNGSHLAKFVWRTHSISDFVKIEELMNLHCLELFAEKELMGDLLFRISCLKHLRVLCISGCPNLKVGQLGALAELENLQELGINSSFVEAGGCAMLARLELSSMKLQFCSGINFDPLFGSTTLKTLWLIECTGACTGALDEHLSVLLGTQIAHLEELKVS